MRQHGTLRGLLESPVPEVYVCAVRFEASAVLGPLSLNQDGKPQIGSTLGTLMCCKLGLAVQPGIITLGRPTGAPGLVTNHSILFLEEGFRFGNRSRDGRWLMRRWKKSECNLSRVLDLLTVPVHSHSGNSSVPQKARLVDSSLEIGDTRLRDACRKLSCQDERRNEDVCPSRRTCVYRYLCLPVPVPTSTYKCLPVRPLYYLLVRPAYNIHELYV